MQSPSPTQANTSRISAFDSVVDRASPAVTSRRVAWWLTFVSLTSYLLSNKFGQPAMLLALGPWLCYGLAYPARGAAWLVGAPTAWVLPFFALVSVLWSIEPDISLRLAVEFVVFTGVSILMARAQDGGGFISALMCALIVCVLASEFFGDTAAIGFTGEIASIGLFGSKNNFAFVTCIMMLSSLSVVADRLQDARMRFLGVLGLLAAPLVLIKTISLGALVSGSVGCVALFSILVYSAVAPRWRGTFLAVLCCFGIVLGGFAAYAIAQGINTDTLLVSLGKDPSLTGRTFLWARAESFIAERPLLGVGYEAFWVQGHVEAEGLWRYADIGTRAGFHFHNLFFATAVELGYVGVAILAAQISAVIVAVSLWSLRHPGPESAFFFGLLLFFLIRMSVELDFLGPFSYGALMIPATWVIATRALGNRMWRPA